MSGSNDRRWSLARATEFFSGDGKPDMYERPGARPIMMCILVKQNNSRLTETKCVCAH